VATRLRIIATAIAIVVLSLAVRLGDGSGSGPALVWLGCAIAALLLAAVGRPRLRVSDRVLGIAMCVSIVAALLINVARPPTVMSRVAPAALRPLAGAIFIIAGAAVLAQIVPRSRRGNALLLPVVLGGGVFAWAWTVHSTPTVYNDVIAFHRAAADALRRGENPYATPMPDVYGPGSTFYSPGMVHDGRLRYGYVYPPIPLLLSAAGDALGDVRWPLVAAGALTAAIIALARPSPRATAAAALFLTAAPVFFVLPLGYTDIYLAAAFAAVIFCAVRVPWATPVMLGVMLATKQYALILLPVVPLLIPPPWTLRRIARWVLIAAAVAALLTLPPLLFDAPAYWRAMVEFHLQQPFRADSLSFLPLIGGAFRWLPVVTWLIASALALRCCPRTPGGFAMAAALVTTTFFAVSHQAFANYYFFAIAAACCAVAVEPTEHAAAAAAPAAARRERTEDAENLSVTRASGGRHQ
jgi:hypothetical protein